MPPGRRRKGTSLEASQHHRLGGIRDRERHHHGGGCVRHRGDGIEDGLHHVVHSLGEVVYRIVPVDHPVRAQRVRKVFCCCVPWHGSTLSGGVGVPRLGGVDLVPAEGG